jgi:hypothetical protein
MLWSEASALDQRSVPGALPWQRAAGDFCGIWAAKIRNWGSPRLATVTESATGSVPNCILSSRGEDTALKRWGLRLCERGGSDAKKRAVVEVAGKLAALLHKLWVSGQSYRPFPAS